MARVTFNEMMMMPALY